jgi:prepilin-type N-terminal cleavage/methylation domain-containing protein
MSISAIHTRLASDHGFTLIETLVAMVAGVVVTGALSMVFVVALHQTSRLTDSVQASQLGRTAMTHVIDELRSACIARGYTPVQKESTASQLIFRDAYGEESIIPNANEAQLAGTGSFQHEIEWNSSAHTLTDFIYPSERGSEWPAYKFPEADYKTSTGEAANAEPKKGILIASNVSETKSGAIFKYYKYGEEATESPTMALSTLKEVPPPATATAAASIAAVVVSFSTAPLDNQTKLSRSAEFSNEVTFAFGTPSSEATINDKPCE